MCGGLDGLDLFQVPHLGLSVRLRQIRQQTSCYAATRAALSPHLRRSDGVSYADVMALPLKEPSRSPQAKGFE